MSNYPEGRYLVVWTNHNGSEYYQKESLFISKEIAMRTYKEIISLSAIPAWVIDIRNGETLNSKMTNHEKS